MLNYLTHATYNPIYANRPQVNHKHNSSHLRVLVVKDAASAESAFALSINRAVNTDVYKQSIFLVIFINYNRRLRASL